MACIIVFDSCFGAILLHGRLSKGRYGDGVIAGSGIEERFMDLVLVFGDR